MAQKSHSTGSGSTGKHSQRLKKERRSVMIHELLNTGAENAINGRDICTLLDIDRRDLQAAVNRERRAGQPICANTGGGNKAGYFLAKDKREMQAYCNSLQHRAGEIHRTRKACLSLMDTLPDSEGE